MIFTVDIKSENDAMVGHLSIIALLDEICNELSNGEKSGMLRDVNGNTVGKWEYKKNA